MRWIGWEEVYEGIVTSLKMKRRFRGEQLRVVFFYIYNIIRLWIIHHETINVYKEKIASADFMLNFNLSICLFMVNSVLSLLLQSSVHKCILFLSVFPFNQSCYFYPFWLHSWMLESLSLFCGSTNTVRSPWNTQHWHLAVEWRLSTGNYFSICYPCIPLALQ